MVIPVKALGVVQFGSRNKVSSIMKEHESVISCINEIVLATFTMTKQEHCAQCVLVFCTECN